MNKRKSLDDTCDVLLSRRHVRFPLTSQRATSELPHHAQTLCAESMVMPPNFYFQRPLEIPELPTVKLSSAPAKLLPMPGSSGVAQAKPVRLPNGRRHIPRPRNPFILFRCDLVHQRRMLPRSGLDDTNISRTAGDLWREMTAAQKKPWVELAAKEKARHTLLYPGYKYAPATSGSKTKRAKNNSTLSEPRLRNQASRVATASPSDHSRTHCQPERVRSYPQPTFRRRSSSSPPVGAAPVPPHAPLEGWLPTTRDDIQRHTSQTTMYQSTPQCVVEPVAPILAGHDPSLPLQGLECHSFPQVDPLLLDSAYPLPNPNQRLGPYATSVYNFLDYQPTFTSNEDKCDSGFTLHNLEMGHTAFETNFVDPFSTLVTIPTDNGMPWTYSTAVSPFDYPRHPAGSFSTPPSGTLYSN